MESLAVHYKWPPSEVKALTLRERREWVVWANYRIEEKRWQQNERDLQLPRDRPSWQFSG